MGTLLPVTPNGTWTTTGALQQLQASCVISTLASRVWQAKWFCDTLVR